jgi:hypothetical protein
MLRDRALKIVLVLLVLVGTVAPGVVRPGQAFAGLGGRVVSHANLRPRFSPMVFHSFSI